MKTSATQKSNGRYVYETKRQGRIAHHHTDATVPHIVALLGFSFHAAKIRTIFESCKLFAEILPKSLQVWGFLSIFADK